MKFHWLWAFCLRATVLAALWWSLLGDEHSAWMVGAPAVVVSALVSLWLLPPLAVSISPVSLLRVAPTMLWRALTGGYDVAIRVLSPQPNINPSMVRYPVSQLKDSTARWCFLHCVSLLPGTLTADFEGDEAVIHVLADESAALRDLARLEADISRLFRNH